jgi:hypothetical protein
MTGQSYRVPDVGGDPLVTSLTGVLARLPGRERSADILAVNRGTEERGGSEAATELRARLVGTGVERVA